MTSNLLLRYTSLASALDILQTRELTLLPPSSWDDEVDRNLMTAYKRKKNLRSVVALCFASTGQTYHHWRVFTEGSSGACISFDRSRLEKAVAAHRVITKDITYKTIPSDRAKPVKDSELPFTKRAAFRDEREVRMLCSSEDEDFGFKRVPFPSGAIEEVILNPWMPDALVETIEKVIGQMRGLPNIEVRKSQLFSSPYWRKVADA